MPSGNSAIVGAAGEHLVMSRLLMNNFVAGLAPTGARMVDVIAHGEDGRALDIQVKARSGVKSNGLPIKSAKWHMQPKHEQWVADNLYYCFVDFAPEQPEVFVLPSLVVADALALTHKLWLEVPGRNGQRHNPDSRLRFINVKQRGQEEGWLEEYRERWDLLRSPEPETMPA